MSCFCKTPSKTVSKGDICCCVCGVVFGPEDVVNIDSQSKRSLFLRKYPGSKHEYKPKHAKRLHIENSVINVISSICGKLLLPRAMEDDVWAAYNELRAMYLQRPNAAAFAIYRVVRLNDLPILDDEIVSTIQAMFKVRRAPRYLAVMSEVHKLKMISPKSYLLTDTRRTMSSRYYLLIHVQMATKKYPKIPADFLLLKAEPIFNASKTVSNADTRAKRAVSHALVKLGVKQ